MKRMIRVTAEAQEILGFPAEVPYDTALGAISGDEVFIYYLDADGCIVSRWDKEPKPIVAMTASCTWGVPRRPHWGSLNGGGMRR